MLTTTQARIQPVAIQTLLPNVTREQAIQTFSAGAASLYWKMRSGTLHRMADAYIPFRIYRVRYPLGRVLRTHLFAMDAVDGSLDPFEFAALPGEAEIVSVCTRNHLAPALSEIRGEELLRDKVLRIIFQRGFFKLRTVNLATERLPAEIHLPYWLGFYGPPANLRFRVMDAVRRRIEGAKVSMLFEEWFAA